MSAQFQISEIEFFSLEQWPVTVCAWRGCCIEVFSRAEHSVADCLRTLENAGIATGKDAHNPFAATRLKALAACIREQNFAKHGDLALMRIAEWEQAYELRALLAHGKMKATAGGISITHITFDGKAEHRAPAKQLTRFDMLAELAAIEAAQKSLHQQLGQIKALARQMAASAAL